MNHSGNVINKNGFPIIRMTGLIATVLLLTYAGLALLGIADGSHIFSQDLFQVTFTIWALFMISLIVLDERNHRHVGFMLVSYHVLVFLYAMFVSGFVSPFLVFWLILFLTSYIYFGQTGVKLSILGLLVIAIADIIYYAENMPAVIEIIAMFMSTLFVGAALIMLTRIQEVDWAEFLSNKQESIVERERLSTIINNLNDSVIATDKNHRIQILNASARNLINSNKNLEKVLIDDVLDIQNLHDRKVKLSNLSSHDTETLSRDDLTIKDDEEVVRLEMTRIPISDQFNTEVQQNGFIYMFRDITKVKSLEDEKDEFISVVSHELRTPIAVAEGTLSNLQLLLDRDALSDDKLSEYIDNTYDQILFLARMVNDLSTLSRAERGVADHAEKIQVDNLMNSLYNDYSGRMKNKKLKLDLDLNSVGVDIKVSELYLRELLQNLITNAIKYTHEGKVTLTTSVDKGIVEFAVVDTGIGISKTDQERIYSKFFRSEDYRTRETRGTGLGLYVAAKLADKLDTKIELKSRLNHGSTFSFKIPVMKRAKKRVP